MPIYNKNDLSLADGEQTQQLRVDKAGRLITTGAGDNAGMPSYDDLDTAGNPVPTYKAHTFGYDGSGNLTSDTVTDGTATWVRTYTYVNGVQQADSGWVKQ